MEYKEIKQTSRAYEYGQGKEFLTREDAQQKVEEVKKNLTTQLALQKLYDKTKVEVIEVENAFQIVATTKIPKLLE